MKTKSFLNRAGQGATQVLVAIGLIAFMASLFAQLMANQQRQLRSLEQKSEALDYKSQMMTALQNANVCSCHLVPSVTVDNSNDANLKFDSTITDGSQEINFPQITSGCGAAGATSQLLTVNQRLASGLEVESIKLKNLRPTGSGDVWTGDWTVAWKQNSFALTPLKSVKVGQRFLIDTTSPTSTPTSRLVKSCIDTSNGPKIASGTNVVGTNPLGNYVIDLADYGFNPAGADPHILVSERDYNFDALDGNTVDASYCGFDKNSKLVFTVTCWTSTNSSNLGNRSSFDWIALQ